MPTLYFLIALAQSTVTRVGREGVCVCVLGGVKENNKQNKKFKVGWPFSVA